jgi:putative hydrolase of HD superfamily
MKGSEFDQLLKFVDLLHAFRAIERRILVKGSDRQENDGEHSFSLAMLAWYVNSSQKLGLDSGKLLMYALAHDIVEIHAGDTYFFQTGESVAADKKKREADAAERLKKEFPEFPELHAAIAAYDSHNDPESKLVYALDKVDPMLTIYRDGGRTWKKENVTLEMLTSMKSTKVAVDPTIEKIFKELVARLGKEPGLFE